jgi:glutathione synthase/RimK-type ligase-like ATP-grasp enzyme
MIISNDKFEIYKFTSDFQPFTSLLSTFFANEVIQKKFRNKIVLKPIRANSGK